jgi:hypothetical protein
MIVIDSYRFGAFQIASLFAAGEAGGWWEPSPSNCFQDAAGTVPAAVGDPVAYLTDLSGRGNHVTQATATKRPTLRQDGSGHHYLEFIAASGQFLDKAFSISQPWDRISAWQQLSWVGGRRLFHGYGVDAGRLYQRPTSPTLELFDGTPSCDNAGLALATVGVITERHAGASSRLAIDNGSYATGNPGTTAPGGISIGGLTGQAGETVGGYFYGGLMRAGTLGNGQISAVRDHFAAIS